MNRSILGVVELQEDYYVPFSNIKLKKGDKIEGYYDGYSITNYNNNICNTYYLGNTKYQFIAKNSY